ncbi:MAG: hypothetical protein LIO65_01860 [Odoribacter sp.]|nr:hypothetical protein [Odoribacter sp.]
MLFFTQLIAQDIDYKRPPKEIEEVVMAQLSPSTIISTDNQWIVFLERTPYVSLQQLAQPELKIAGERINPNNFGESRQTKYTGISIMKIGSDKKTACPWFTGRRCDSWRFLFS